MELVYLWVEDYKNIHKQGFNFSPRFECEYKDGNLTICDKKEKDNKCKNKDYIENFFGDNINVTAIIGKNGSGKSSVLELLFYLCAKGIKEQGENFYAIYFSLKLNKFLVVGNLNITYNLVQDLSYLMDDTTDCHHSIYFKNFYERLHLNQLLATSSDSFCKRHDISLSSQLKINTHGNFENQVGHYYANNIKLSIILLKTTSIKLPNDFSRIKSIKFNFKIDIHFMPKLSYLKKYKQVFFNLYCQYFNHKINSKNYDELIRDKNRMISTHKNFLENTEQFLMLLPESKEEYTFEEVSPEFIDSYLHIVSMTKEFLDFAWQPSLSSGEETLLFQFANFYNVIKKNEILLKDDKSYTLYIDEGENSLHPNWQKKYISYIVQFFKDNFPKNEIYIILTSHSPFLLSDIPKQNIIFLDTYKKEDEKVQKGKQKVGNCKVLTHDEVLNKKQTFGANIHTLLSDSFFMKDGLMGEFAESKIKEIINFHKEVEEENKKENSNFDLLKTKYESHKKRFWQIQSIIGEDYLKQVIKNHLIYIENILLGHDEAKEEDIKRLRAEADRLESM